MPRVVAYFDSLPDRLPAMQQRYDAIRPRIVSLSIENGSDTVDPDLREIAVRFDRPVSDDGWSVVPALGPSGPVPGAQERFPKITWKSLDSARATFAQAAAIIDTIAAGVNGKRLQSKFLNSEAVREVFEGLGKGVRCRSDLIGVSEHRR